MSVLHVGATQVAWCSGEGTKFECGAKNENVYKNYEIVYMSSKGIRALREYHLLPELLRRRYVCARAGKRKI